MVPRELVEPRMVISAVRRCHTHKHRSALMVWTISLHSEMKGDLHEELLGCELRFGVIHFLFHPPGNV